MTLHHCTQVQRAQGVKFICQGQGLGQHKIPGILQQPDQMRSPGMEHLQGLRHVALRLHRSTHRAAGNHVNANQQQPPKKQPLEPFFADAPAQLLAGGHAQQRGGQRQQQAPAGG